MANKKAFQAVEGFARNLAKIPDSSKIQAGMRCPGPKSNLDKRPKPIMSLTGPAGRPETRKSS